MFFLPGTKYICAPHFEFWELYLCSCGFDPENWSLCLTISEKQTKQQVNVNNEQISQSFIMIFRSRRHYFHFELGAARRTRLGSS